MRWGIPHLLGGRMEEKKITTSKRSLRQRLWRWLKKPWLWGIPAGIYVAVLAVGAFHGVIEASSQNVFCYSCHLKMDTIVQEYKASPHYGDEHHVKATCAECHVPNDFVGKMEVKIKALADVYYMLDGRITKENFEQQRPRLAKIVWKDMLADDSANCRHCHQGKNFDLEKQPQRARLNHQQMKKRGETCIDCHMGIAHKRVVVE